MKRSVFSVVGTFTVVATLVGPALGGPTATQKCQSKKVQEAGKYSLCRMKAEAKAAKDGSTPDFSKCNEKLAGKFQKIEGTFGSACPTTGDASQVQGEVADFTAALSCELKGSSEPAGGSIVAVTHIQVGAGSDPTLTVRNRSNQLIGAFCFLASDTVCSPAAFTIFLPLQSEVSWTAGAGSPEWGIPGLASPFSGDLVCIEIDASGSPLAGNHLVASATYSGQCPIFGIAISGNENNDGDTQLCLGDTVGEPTAECPTGNEYDSCPAGLDPTRMEGCWSQVPLPSPPYSPGTLLIFRCNGN